ncbi:hypothetical protein BGZ46_000846 [Entomortierella lignicola]|nr:hypothetical protein BGZ46_000846 [Entomortierella lignicola]
MERGFQPPNNQQSPYTPYPQPPTLSFRSFHEKHFSRSQQQVFFAGLHSTSWFNNQQFSWNQGHNEIPNENNTVVDQSYQHFQEAATDESHEFNHPLNNHVEELEATTELDHKSPIPHLSKEAIEIFEFSRRFRQEKEAAALLEKTRLKKRRTKRRKLTKLGFAFDEGNSGSESSAAEEDHAVEGQTKSFNANQYLSESSSDLEDDEAALAQELPPTDVSFMNQKSRRTNMIRQGLYGDGNNGAQNQSGINMIEMLESLVNQKYEDSIVSPAVSKASENTKRQRSHGGEAQSQSQVVYWPGLPLRC